MLVFRRKAVVAPGQIMQALAFANEVAAYVNGLYPEGPPVWVGTGIGGRQTTLHWISQHENFAAWESRLERLMSDQTYMDMVQRAAPLFLPDSIEDDLVRTFS